MTVIAGQLGGTPVRPDGKVIPAWTLVDIAGGVEAAMADPVPALVEAGRRAAAHWSATPA